MVWTEIILMEGFSGNTVIMLSDGFGCSIITRRYALITKRQFVHMVS